ncbi:MAG: Sapep family Mn(2+)-dependent dipeptidase [Clostridia bacterium]|nr:Sapep family Mn(2+)-dependent dipeptidase [Clostridia bacterium]
MEKYFDDVVRSISEIIRFDSSLQPADGDYPFGKETADCLHYFLDLASNMGFETKNYDNYVGEVVFGDGEEFAVLAHLDVVPAGNGWKYPPFGGVINDDPSDGGVEGMKIWGRGAMDDKGPAIACLYVLKALKDEGFVPTKKIKLIVGCNEEAGWKCIEHYKKVASMPKEGFSPDANFPVIYAEKGILHFTINLPIHDAPMSALNAGQRPNMVCDHAQAFLTKYAGSKLVNYENPIEGTQLSYDNTTNLLQAYGKSAHGSTPQRGANALQALLYFLSTFNEDCKKAYDLLFADVYGLQTLKDETGALTISPNVANFANGILKITTDIRFPATMNLKTVTDKLDESGIAYSIDSYQAPLFHDKKSELITSLTEIYNDATGKKEEPIAIGGGTYARALECGCAFGPEINGEEDTIHQANEYVTFDRIKLMCDVYYQAIKKVCGPKVPLRLRAATIQKRYASKAQAEPVEKSQEKTEGVKILTLRIGTKLK